MKINVAYQEFKTKLVDLINNSGVPMFMIQECLELVQTKVSQLAAQELEQAKREDEESQQTNAEEDVV